MEEQKVNGFISFEEHNQFKELMSRVLKNRTKMKYSFADFPIEGFFSKETPNLFKQTSEQFPKTLENLEDEKE